MFLSRDQFDAAGGAVASPPRVAGPVRPLGVVERALRFIDDTDWAPDLGAAIGSTGWFRGLATLMALIASAVALSPGLARTVPGAVAAPLADADWAETRAQGIAPLAWGADSGRRMAAGERVVALRDTPERPELELTATLSEGDRFAALLQRAGVGRVEASQAAELVGQTVKLDDLKSGTRIDLMLGRRATKNVPRPLERIAFRAAFDLNLTLLRGVSGGLVMQRQRIAIDDTPLRLQGLVGSSLYRSARAAGAPPRAVEAFIKALATRVQIGAGVSAGDTFDLVVAQRRAATGEIELGELLFAGLDQGKRKVQLVRWKGTTGESWYDATGNGQSQTTVNGFNGWPVAGRLTSGFGMRVQPIIGLLRMHPGIDIAAPTGTPIRAVADGIVTWASWKGGYGNYVLIDIGGGYANGFGHMSRIAVTPGMRVMRGQVIGYVGSTGFSTGPHVHFELRKGGVPINPRLASYKITTGLSGDQLRAFKARAAMLLAIRPGSVR